MSPGDGGAIFIQNSEFHKLWLLIFLCLLIYLFFLLVSFSCVLSLQVYLSP